MHRRLAIAIGHFKSCRPGYIIFHAFSGNYVLQPGFHGFRNIHGMEAIVVAAIYFDGFWYHVDEPVQGRMILNESVDPACVGIKVAVGSRR